MLIRIDQDFHEHLTDTEKKVIAFINANMTSLSSMSISDVAEATFSSPATVSRTIKKCGISGFAELRYLMNQQTAVHRESLAVNEIFTKSQEEVENTVDRLESRIILKAVKEIRDSKRIYILSRGLTELVAKEFSLKLNLLGFNVFANSDPAMMQTITAHAKKKELIVIFSLSGATPELVRAAENAVSLGSHIIVITCGNSETPLNRLANISICGYKHSHTAVKEVDATSRLPLYVISRIIIDYLVQEIEAEKEKAAKKEAAYRKKHYF